MLKYSTCFHYWKVLANQLTPLDCAVCAKLAPERHSGPSYAPFLCERQRGRRCFMHTQSRFSFFLGRRASEYTSPSLPIDTQAKRGIYSPHLEFCSLAAVAAGVASGANKSRGFQREGLAQRRSFRQSRHCLNPAWRLHASGNAGAVAFPVQNGRLELNSFQARGTGSPLLSGKRNTPSRPDLPVLQLENSFDEQNQCDFSDFPCFRMLRHGKDFNAIRRGQ